MSALRASAVVIGSGPGGAVTAHTLATHGVDVIILEDGPNLPLDSCPPFSIEEMAQKYRARGLSVALGNSPITFVEARTAGGGSEVNSGLYHRTPAEILEQWRSRFKLSGTGFDDLRPHFEACEKAVHVSPYPVAPPLASRKLAEGALQLGWRVVEVPRWFRYSDGPEGGRQSMTRTFLPAAAAAGARLLAGVRAQRLEQTGSSWIIHALRSGEPLEIRADTVFACGGALQTPLLLRRSGIRRNIGNTLAMHPTVKAVAVFDEEVNHERLGVPVHQVKEFSPRLSFGCSISSRPHLALALAGHRDAPRLVNEGWRHMAVYYAMITGPRSGTVRAIPGCDDPLVRYRLCEQDLRDLATGLRKLTQMLLAAGARAVYPAVGGLRPITSPAEVSAIPATLPGDRANLMTIHLFSSCPMGEDESACPVNSFGEVRGASNLSVHDASIIPSAPGVNPQGTIMALARRNTFHFLDSRGYATTI